MHSSNDSTSASNVAPPDRQYAREKYSKMLERAGLDQTLTAIHREMTNYEPHIFDGGYAKERLEYLEFLRTLAREIYTTKFKL